MAQRILNVDNGPGSNGLRGGIKTYSAKTTTGQWLEEYGGPARYKRGFTNDEFETEAQHAQTGALGKSPGYFGAAIPLTTSTPDQEAKETILSFYPTKNDWTTNTSQSFQAKPIAEAKADNFKLLEPTLSRAQLEEYRNKWTYDTEKNRNQRFQTTSRSAGNAGAPAQFTTNSLRMLPGTPSHMENYRARIVERYGLFALSMVRLKMGNEALTFPQFREAVYSIGVNIKSYEYSQILAYVTASNTALSAKEVQDFIKVLKGNIDGYQESAVEAIFRKICAEDGTATLFDLQGAIDTSKNPELVDALAQIYEAYSTGDDQTITLNAFHELHRDMYASAPQPFSSLLSSVWKIS